MSENSELHERAARLDDAAWRSAWEAKIDGDPEWDWLPDFPDPETQLRFVGSIGKRTLDQAFDFYSHVLKEADRLGVRLSDRDFLDFGMGWGRFTRLFARNVPPDRLNGADVNPKILELCARLGVPGRHHLIEPRGRLPFEDGTLGAGIAYSVFTHLPESVHLHWRDEFARCLAPGGLMVLTIRQRDFLARLSRYARAVYGPKRFGFRIGLMAKPAATVSPHERMLAAFGDQASDLLKAFDKQRFVFIPTNEGVEDTYGDAAVPLAYMINHWSDAFDIVGAADFEGGTQHALTLVRR